MLKKLAVVLLAIPMFAGSVHAMTPRILPSVMHIFLPVLTVWSKQSVYVALGIRHAVMRFADPDDIATPSMAPVGNSRTSR